MNNKTRTAFVRVSEDEWRFARGVAQNRSQRLLHAATFESLIGNISKKNTLIFHGRQSRKKAISEKFYRVIIKLKIDERIVDIFHNSSFGYRAQYFSSVKNGERANAYALNSLIPVVRKLMEKHEKHTCPWWWVEKSLRNPTAKIWIHQGLWLHYARKEDEKLNAWKKNWHATLTKEEKKKLKWGCLMPENESFIEIKGGYITLGGVPEAGAQKPNRSKDIHRFGFT